MVQNLVAQAHALADGFLVESQAQRARALHLVVEGLLLDHFQQCCGVGTGVLGKLEAPAGGADLLAPSTYCKCELFLLLLEQRLH